MPRHVLRGPDLARSCSRCRNSSRRRSIAIGCGISPASTSSPNSRQTMSSSIGSAVLREDRIAELLELLQDLVVDARVVVIRPAQQDDAEAVFPLESAQSTLARRCRARSTLVSRRAPCSPLPPRGRSPPRKAEHVLELLEHLALNSTRAREVLTNVSCSDALLGEDVPFLGEGGLHRLRGRRALSDRCGCLDVNQSVNRQSTIGKKMKSSGFLSCSTYKQVVDVRDADLGREAGVDGPPLGTFLIELLAGVVGEHEVLGLDSEGCEVAREHGRHRVHVEDARHADAQLGALLHQFGALLLRRTSA